MSKTKKKILVTGASGYVGSSIYKGLKNSGYNVYGLYYKTKLFDDLIHVNITNERDLKAIITNIKPNIIIHAAADAHGYTCEKDPDNAQKLNVNATRFIADISSRHEIKLLHISTFACYNKNPSGMYPKTKIEAEQIVKNLKEYVILRLSLVTGLSPNVDNENFYNKLIKSFVKRQSLEADSVWQFEMTYLGHVNEVINKLITDAGINKVMIPVIEHGITSRYKIARDLFKNFNLKVKEGKSKRKIIPVTDINESLYNKFDLTRRTYKEGLGYLLKELKSLA